MCNILKMYNQTNIHNNDSKSLNSNNIDNDIITIQVEKLQLPQQRYQQSKQNTIVISVFKQQSFLV